MKNRILACLCLFALSIFACASDAREALWESVDKAIDNQLPKTALEHLDKILPEALEEKAYAEATMAMAMKIRMEASIDASQMGVTESAIKRLNAEIQKAPTEMLPVLHTIHALWLWEYYEDNRHKIPHRTRTDAPPGDDFSTWDPATILSEIDSSFSSALGHCDTLKATPISDWMEMIDPGTVPTRYRPTLYDLLAHEALSFYQIANNHREEIRFLDNLNKGLPTSEGALTIQPEDPIFAPANEFMAWKPETTDPQSPTLKAIRLFQDLLRFHASDTDPSAFFDADLARIEFGYHYGVTPEAKINYIEALSLLAEQSSNHDISSLALARIATGIIYEDVERAYSIAKAGFSSFPQSDGGKLCQDLISGIELPILNISHRMGWNTKHQPIQISSRNVSHVHFRLIEMSIEEHMGARTREIEEFPDILSRAPTFEWSSMISDTSNVRDLKSIIYPPKPVSPGFYLLVVSGNADFTQQDNLLIASQIMVSDLNIIVLPESIKGEASGIVISSLTGDPISDAIVQIWKNKQQRPQQNDFAWRTSDLEVVTNQDGLFTFPASIDDAVFIQASKDDMRFISDDLQFLEYLRSSSITLECSIVTDRSIYRPGQCVHYKGILFQTNRDIADYHTQADEKVTVVFYDTKNQEIARAEHTSNEFGSFSGTFTAPRNLLTGTMHIAALDRFGRTFFGVEDYKRPKFEVTLDAPDQSRLNQSITVIGNATSYTGASLDSANVSWNVTRYIMRRPSWIPKGNSDSGPFVIHGTTTCERDGTFRISFEAVAESELSESTDVIYSFEVNVYVTDATGETRSTSKEIRVGNTSAQVDLRANSWMSLGESSPVKISTSTLNGNPLSLSGVLTVHTLIMPEDATPNPHHLEADLFFVDTAQPSPIGQIRNWKDDKEILQIPISTNSSGNSSAPINLPKAGAYRFKIEAEDPSGRTIRAHQDCIVTDPLSDHFPIDTPFALVSSGTTVYPGETYSAVWGSMCKSSPAFIEVFCNGKPIQRYWTRKGYSQHYIRVPVTDSMRGGFQIRVTQKIGYKLFNDTILAHVPWQNKNLNLKWESFRSRLKPNEETIWIAIVNKNDSEDRSVEMAATLYDASLDTFNMHKWSSLIRNMRHDIPLNRPSLGDCLLGGEVAERGRGRFEHFESRYPRLNASFGFNGPMYSSYFSYSVRLKRDWYHSFYESIQKGIHKSGEKTDYSVYLSLMMDDDSIAPDDSDLQNLDAVHARKNLQETAFFYPHLLSDKDGAIRIEFTMPEALTRWKFLGLAHDKDLRSGLLTGTATTSKDLMVQPNPPRFVREGDQIAFPVKVTNRSAEAISGKVRLTFADAATLNPVDSALGNLQPELPFEIPAGESRTYSWDITVPDGMGFLTYKAVGASANLSDGEEAYLPVISRGILLTESLPLPIRGKGTREFSFDKLLASADSDTLRHQSLKVQMVSQPAWYAVMALPYLMEFPHECSEQLFSRLYANALASHIANSDPKIRRVFDLWRESSSLESPLFQNEDIKGVMIEETPWMRDALGESEARRQLGLLFESNRLQEETDRGLRQLSERQLENGLWPWFPGGVGSHYISRYIVCGFGRLSRMGVDMDTGPALKALPALDLGLEKQYKYITHTLNSKDYVPGHLDALDLYTRSFFLESKPIDDKHRKAFDYFLNQARKHWNKSGSLQTQVHLAIALHRFGDQETAHAIMQSVKERAVHHEEFGMYWKAHSERWWWYHAPIETQALIIEAFAEITKDFEAVEDCKIWLLKQKQTQQWESTKATADAVYAMLNHGSNLLASDALVEVSLGGETIQPEHVEAGTGFYEQTWIRNEIRPDMGKITLRKTDDGVAWGSAHWQYIEDIEKVTPHEDNPLKLRKSLWIKQTGESGPVLKPVSGPLAPGDELVVRIELRADRDFEFVHMKDQRGSGTEPVNVLSRYKWQDRLSYYESTRDTATHFFIDNLPKGTYVFEYSTRIQHRGTYQSGIASIQCMYAPEFNSHSQSFTIQVE